MESRLGGSTFERGMPEEIKKLVLGKSHDLVYRIFSRKLLFKQRGFTFFGEFLTGFNIVSWIQEVKMKIEGFKSLKQSS
jgi:hypothetical protein